MGRLTYLKNGRPCLLINGSEYFGPVAERLHAYEETGYEPCEVHDLADRCSRAMLESGQRNLEVAHAALKVVLDSKAYTPLRAHPDDAGLDLMATQDYSLGSMRRIVIDTGVHIQIPRGYVGRLTSKSSMTKAGVMTTGTIDAGYTGSIKVVLFNLSRDLIRIEKGQKIAQLVIHPIITPQIEVVDEMEETERGDGGFGSTGAYASEEEFEAAVQRNLARLYEEQERRKAAEGVNDGKV